MWRFRCSCRRSFLNSLMTRSTIIYLFRLSIFFFPILMPGSCCILRMVATHYQTDWGHGQPMSHLCQATSERKEPLMPLSFPDTPWTRLGTDLFELDRKTYQVVIDYTSRWFEVRLLHSVTASGDFSLFLVRFFGNFFFNLRYCGFPRLCGLR